MTSLLHAMATPPGEQPDGSLLWAVDVLFCSALSVCSSAWWSPFPHGHFDKGSAPFPTHKPQTKAKGASEFPEAGGKYCPSLQTDVGCAFPVDKSFITEMGPWRVASSVSTRARMAFLWQDGT